MRSIKSILFIWVITLLGFAASAESALTLNNPAIELRNCQGTARLIERGMTPYLVIQAAQCSFIRNDMGQLEKVSPEGFPLERNHSYSMTVTSERGDRTGHVDQFMVNTYGPGPRPEPYPRQHIPSVDLYGSGSAVSLPSCGGSATFHQTFFTETPRLNFEGVSECTYYTVLSASDDAMVLDATQSRLQKGSFGWLGQFDLPNRWGTNKVRIRLQSATGEHAVDIFVHFVTR